MTCSDSPSPTDDAPSDVLRITVSEHDGAAVVGVAGEIDLVTAPRLREVVTAAVASAPAVVVVDLSAVTFLGSSGIRLLLNAHTSVAGSSRFAVVATRSVTLRPLQVTGVDQELAVFDSVDAALSGG